MVHSIHIMIVHNDLFLSIHGFMLAKIQLQLADGYQYRAIWQYNFELTVK